MQSPIQLSAAQIKKFTSLITANNRPVQPLHHHVTVSDAVAEEVVAK
jgi:carbonic anhydrase